MISDSSTRTQLKAFKRTTLRMSDVKYMKWSVQEVGKVSAKCQLEMNVSPDNNVFLLLFSHIEFNYEKSLFRTKI